MEYPLLKNRYYKLFEEHLIAYIFPNIYYNPSDKAYQITLDVEKRNEFLVKFGGNFSSKPINTGYLGCSIIIWGNFLTV